MDSSDQLPSERATLKRLGEVIAEAWYEAEGERPVLVLRIPRDRLQLADEHGPLTLENVLTAASVSSDEVESWRLAQMSGENLQLNESLPLPLPDATHLCIQVRLKAAAPDETSELEIPLEKWQALEACWKGILGLEASIDASRLGMDSLRAELETAFKRTMTVEEKLHALQSDVAQLNKAKSRVHHALPKVREFIHRATWALAVPERKRLEEIYKARIEPRISIPQVDHVREQMEHLQKDRQVLFAQGNAVYQECRGILGEIQRAVSALQRNAADNARRKRDAKNQKGKHF